jgi:predicted ATPase
MLRRFPGGIVYVPLASLRDADMAMAAVGAALGLVEDPARSCKDVVIGRVRPATMLLVLDNLEQIMDAG